MCNDFNYFKTVEVYNVVKKWLLIRHFINLVKKTDELSAVLIWNVNLDDAEMQRAPSEQKSQILSQKSRLGSNVIDSIESLFVP